jgi:hypothetical protein
MSRRPSVAASWRTDVATARADLEAGAAEAYVLAVHALAWRTTLLTLPVSLVVAGWFVARGDADPSALLVAAGLGVLVPQVGGPADAPVDVLATLRTWRRGSRAEKVRFGLVYAVYPYYGWRYAFRGRRRPWGALTREERLRVNPNRVGGPPIPP